MDMLKFTQSDDATARTSPHISQPDRFQFQFIDTCEAGDIKRPANVMVALPLLQSIALVSSDLSLPYISTFSQHAVLELPARTCAVRHGRLRVYTHRLHDRTDDLDLLVCLERPAVRYGEAAHGPLDCRCRKAAERWCASCSSKWGMQPILRWRCKLLSSGAAAGTAHPERIQREDAAVLIYERDPRHSVLQYSVQLPSDCAC